jgi:hypothetical protein
MESVDIGLSSRLHVVMNVLNALTQTAGEAASRPADSTTPPPTHQGPDPQSIQKSIDRMGFGCARRIGFAVEAGHVTLNGIVRSFAQKQLAQHLVMQVPGVGSLSNQLLVE